MEKSFNKNFNDPKIEEFKKIIRDQISKDKNRKIIIFSEFSDTANYLFENIKKEFRCYLYTSKQSTNKKLKMKSKII